MEFKSVNSKLILEDTKLITEIDNLVFKFVDKKYLTIKYDTIKSFKIVSWKPVSYIIYFVGVFIGLCFFVQHQEVVQNGYYITIPIPMVSRVLCIFLGLIVLYLGYRYDKSFSKYFTINVKYFEGKVKTSQIFTSLSKDELTTIQNEIQSRMTINNK
jgi:hypothetical protein